MAEGCQDLDEERNDGIAEPQAAKKGDGRCRNNRNNDALFVFIKTGRDKAPYLVKKNRGGHDNPAYERYLKGEHHGFRRSRENEVRSRLRHGKRIRQNDVENFSPIYETGNGCNEHRRNGFNQPAPQLIKVVEKRGALFAILCFPFFPEQVSYRQQQDLQVLFQHLSSPS